MITIQDVVKLATTQLELEDEIQFAEEKLKTLKEEHRAVSQENLPNMMAEIGIEEFKLPNGFKVSIRDDYYAKIPETMWYQAFDWLKSKNLDGIVKTSVSVDFGKGEDQEAQRVLDMLTQAGVVANIKSNIHPMTLKAFVKEQIMQGTGLPMDAFGAGVLKKTVIKEV